jgi:hypothetical protein
LVAVAAPAFAHNALTASDPADGATMEQGPDGVRLTFRQSLDPLNSTFEVTGPVGPAVTGEPVIDGASATIPVLTDAAGRYEVAYEVLSGDGDWVDGAVEFTVTVGVVPPPEPELTMIPTTPPPPATIASADPVANQTGAGGGSGPAWWAWALVGLLVAAVAGYGGYRLRRRPASAS